MKWQSIEDAPRGRYVEKRIGKEKVATVFSPDRVLTWKSGDDWRVSWFLPQGVEGAKDGDRWNFYTKDAPPTHFLEIETPESGE